jgi:quinol monooxygenase YgiN
MSQIAAAVTFVAKPGREDDLAALFVRMHAAAITDDGCDLYSVTRSQRKPGTFVLIEYYRDQESLRRHQDNPTLKELSVEVPELIESMTMHLCDHVSGDAAGRV